MDESKLGIENERFFVSARESADPMSHTDVYTKSFPLPHLETFLEEIMAIRPDLIDSDFVVKLFSVSTEDVVPNNSQMMFAKLMAYGYCSNPDKFLSAVTIVMGSNGFPFVRSNTTAKQAIYDTTAGIVAVGIFGLDPALSELIKQSQVLPTNTIIRLAQIGVLNEETFRKYEEHRHNSKTHNLSTAASLSLHRLDPVIESRLSAHSGNADVLRFLCLTSRTSVVADALDNGVSFDAVIEAIQLAGASPVDALSARTSDIDNDLLERLING